MALFILQPGLQPLGDFDCLDTDLANVEGGQIGVLDEDSRTVTSTEKAAADVLDGYIADQVDIGTATATRVVLRLADNASETTNLFYLLDDGNEANYGSLYGEVIGAPVGLSTTGTRLGPHSALASGKVTAWDKAGLYGVTLTSIDTDVVPTTEGTNKYDTPLPGTLLYRGGTTAQLTRATTSSDKIALFVELAASGSLVTTPGRLVGAAESFDRIVIQYLGATHNA